MTRAEKILCILSMMSVILKVMLIPGSGLMTVTFFTLWAMLYFPFGFITLNNVGWGKIFTSHAFTGISGKRIAGTILTGLVFTTIITGMLFKIQSYPGAYNLYNGILLLIVVSIVVYRKHSKNESPFYEKMLRRILIIGIFGLIILIIPGILLQKIFHRNNAYETEATANL